MGEGVFDFWRAIFEKWFLEFGWFGILWGWWLIQSMAANGWVEGG